MQQQPLERCEEGHQVVRATKEVDDFSMIALLMSMTNQQHHLLEIPLHHHMSRQTGDLVMIEEEHGKEQRKTILATIYHPLHSSSWCG